MASFNAVPIQFERDLRSANKDFKRQKDASSKWAFGSRPMVGYQIDWFTGEAFDGRGVKSNKCRPRHKYSNVHHAIDKDCGNIVKWNRAHPLLPPSRLRVNAAAADELAAADEITDALRLGGDLNCLLGPAPRSFCAASNASATASGFLYSFDNTDSPPPVLTLDFFVKPNVRATEKLVEREYEVLDANGQSVKGRKARKMLRQAANNKAADAALPLTDGEDFELV